MAPIREDEGMYISLCAGGDCDFAVRLGPGKFCVVTGKPCDPTLTGRDGKGQNYISPQIQGRLDGFCEDHGQVSQFVGVPLHGGETMEVRLSGRAEHGGLIHEELQSAGRAFDYDEVNSLRVFVHLLNAAESEHVLGRKLPREDEWP